MTAFDYQRCSDFAELWDAIARPGAVPMGGGTDLLVAIEEGLVAPRLVADVRGVHGADQVTWNEDGSLSIGTAARIATIAADERIRKRFPALAMACEAVGSPALRNMGTIGGNLCQRPRCWYFRSGVHCLKAGGHECPAVEGENQLHAILGDAECVAVHPSDPAVALVALEASVHIGSRTSARVLPLDEFFVMPSPDPQRETVLDAGEVVTRVDVPAHSAGGRQRYVKLMQRGAWDFALASLAAVRRTDGTVRLVLGGVAAVPWRVDLSVEEDVAAGPLSDDDLDALADRALYDARPLTRNGYKVGLAKTLLKDGMRFAGEDDGAAARS